MVQEAMDIIGLVLRKQYEKKWKENQRKLCKFHQGFPTGSINLVKVKGKELESWMCYTAWFEDHQWDLLSWKTYTDYIVKRAHQRPFCLNMLKHAKVSPKDIVQIYCSKIGPIVEYAAPVCHGTGGLMQEQSDSIKHI